MESANRKIEIDACQGFELSFAVKMEVDRVRPVEELIYGIYKILINKLNIWAGVKTKCL